MDIGYQVEDVAISHFAPCKMSKQANLSFKVCFCFRRIFKLGIPEPPEDVKALFQEYSRNETITLDGLLKFLTEFQGEDKVTKDDAQAIFNSLRRLNLFQRKGLHPEAFFRYLLSDLNAPLSPSNGVHHDMNAPLSHYFLYTGHNSYLTGNQVSSDSSTQPIVRALLRGVRVIELDLWPNKNQDNVEVRHGGTLTSSVDVLKCLRAIKEHAFRASEYPVVITFEDHLPQNLQAKVAKMVSGTFGDMLFCPASDQLEEFPSPESLKKKVMISTKPPTEYLETKETTHKPKNSSTKEHWEIEGTGSKSEPRNYDKDRLDEGEEKTVPEYRHLIAIHAGKLKGDLENWLKVDVSKVRRLSLSEQELENATRTRATDIIRFTQRNLLRVYPRGIRLDSSNYNPFVGWMHGAQMVAFNMQGYGKYLWIMQGMFRANGGCGYVKKPKFLLQLGPNNEVFDPRMQLPVKVYMGEGWHLDFRHTHFDQYSPPDFYVKVGIAGVPADKAKKQTRVVHDSWLPQWNQDFEFPLTVPELAVLRIEVKEYDTTRSHDFGGQTYLPVSELRTGIRAVPLHDRRGEKYKSVRLLMKFELD